MSVEHIFLHGDEDGDFFYQDDSTGEVALAATDCRNRARSLKSPVSAVAALSIARKMLLAEIAVSTPPEHYAKILAQETAILATLSVVAVPRGKESDA